jgi:uncharacterized damage-inducible protein DinB
MFHFFEYNWQVRDEWFDLLETLSYEQLHQSRTGGAGSIAFTLFHIILVEHNWISGLGQRALSGAQFKDYQGIAELRQLSQTFRKDIEEFISNWQPEMAQKRLASNLKQEEEFFSYPEVLAHVIAHEIHHIGQLSIWARELGLKPASANFIRRGLL